MILKKGLTQVTGFSLSFTSIYREDDKDIACCPRGAIAWVEHQQKNLKGEQPE